MGETMNVVVIGGGLAGVAAAVSAAKEKVSVTLVEKHGFLGGLATAGWVGPFHGYTIWSSKEPVVRGFLEEVVDRLHKKGGSISFPEGIQRGSIPFNAETLKIVLDEIVQDYNINVYLHTVCIGARVDNGIIKTIEVYTKNGRQVIPGSVFIDCTGDGDLIFLSGGKYNLGREEDGRVQAMGSFFRIANVKDGWQADKEKIQNALEEAREKGHLAIWTTGFSGNGSAYGTGDFSPNVSQFAGNPTNSKDITTAEMFLRSTAWKFLAICKKTSPAFVDAHILFAPHIGIRESRRMKGLYELTAEDILQAKKYPDGIARASYPIDIHCPLGRTKDKVLICIKTCPTKKPCIMLDKYPDRLPSRMFETKDDDYYSIPYRCLVSATIQNLLAAGRCVSATHQAFSAIRVMPTCIAMGQASGVAGALAAKRNQLPKDLPVDDIRRMLAGQNALT